MLKKYISKFAMDIFPSVAATIIGAYIVNHYIAKPSADVPAAAAVSPAQVKKSQPIAAATSSSEVKSSESKSLETGAAEARPAETFGETARIPEPGVKARGISEKAIAERASAEKASAEKAAVAEKGPIEKPAEKLGDKPAETASISVETRRHALQPRERLTAKPVSAPVQALVPIAAPTNVSPPLEAAPAQEERRDANDLARAAIARLRGGEASPRAQDASRIPEQPRAAAPPATPLPPPITVSAPAGESFETPAASHMSAPEAGAMRGDGFARPTPPADIPAAASAARPLDLHAEVIEQGTRERTTVAEDVLSAAKSVFKAVLPKQEFKQD
jgi:hypothetical protein